MHTIQYVAALQTGSVFVTSLTGCQMDSGRALWDTMAPMVFSWDGWLGVVIKCNFTGREAKQYSGEQGQ